MPFFQLYDLDGTNTAECTNISQVSPSNCCINPLAALTESARSMFHVICTLHSPRMTANLQTAPLAFVQSAIAQIVQSHNAHCVSLYTLRGKKP